MIPTFTAGQELAAADLNALADAARAADAVSYDPGSGLESTSYGFGRAIRTNRPLAIWVKITSGGTGGIYGGTQQIEIDDSGGWSDGPRVFTSGSGRLREVNSNEDVPIDGSVIVRAWNDRYCWCFQYGACS